jgi:hypothetical protein
MRVWYRTTRSSIGIRATFLDLIANAIRQSRRMPALPSCFWLWPARFGIPETGSFILIDSESGDTVGLGIIETTKPSLLSTRDKPSSSHRIDRGTREVYGQGHQLAGNRQFRHLTRSADHRKFEDCRWRNWSWLARLVRVHIPSVTRPDGPAMQARMARPKIVRRWDSAPKPAVKFTQCRRGLAEAEVAAPSD